MREITRTVLKFLVGLGGVVVVSAFLAPWLYTFLPFKFDRILRRLIMIGAVGLVVWLLRRRRESLGRLGLDWRKESASLLSIGFVAGALLVAILSFFQWALGARIWQLHGADVWHWIGFYFKGFGAGMLIGAIEEFFFRGFLFVTFKDLWNVKGSLIMTNLVYAVVHFFPKDKPLLGAEPTALDSFRIIGFLIPSLLEKPETSFALAGLFLFGVILSLSFLRTGSLYLPMGIHAGCVFGLKMNRRFVPEVAGKLGVLSGSKNLYDGISGLVTLAVLAFLLSIGLRTASSRKPKRKVLLLIFAVGMLFPSGIASAAESSVEPPKEIRYSFLQGLPKAQPIRKRGSEIFESRWRANRFGFNGLARSAGIFVSGGIAVAGKSRPVIRFQALPGFESSLNYPAVPPGRRLHIFFALADSDFKKGDSALVQFEVLIGEKKLFETRINSRGWQERTLDLTLPFLLQRSSRFSFRVHTYGDRARNFVFFGYIE